MLVEPNQPLLPQSFRTRKTQILANLSQTIPPQPPSGPVPSDPLPDKSPKGSVDSQITTLITEINGYEGLVTTSSCAGRVSVYVEGRGTAGAVFTPDGDGDGETRLKATATVGGKGGGRWAYVSHDPIGSGIEKEDDYYYTKLFGLNTSKPDETFSRTTTDGITYDFAQKQQTTTGPPFVRTIHPTRHVRLIEPRKATAGCRSVLGVQGVRSTEFEEPHG